MAAAILCFLWVVWPLLAFAGGLAFAPVVGVAAIFSLPFAFTSLRPRLYMVALLAFFGFAAASAMWSPRPFTFVEINLAAGDFNIRSEVARLALLILALGVLAASATRLDDPSRRVVSRVATFALLLQLAVVAALTLFEQQALQLFLPLMPETGEGVQNISRNSLIMAVAAPALILTLAENRSRADAVMIAVAILGIECAILAARGVHAGLLSLGGAGLAIVIVRLLPRHGFRVIAIGIASIILSAPLVFGFFARGADASLADTSMEWRLSIWNRVHEVILEDPVKGSGLGVLRTIDDRIPSGAFAGNLLVPNHSHNMTLQLWAETGVIGAGLLALAIIMAGWRLPAPAALGRAAPRIAALAGGMTAIACVSFDLWNEWWWAVGGILAVLAASVPKSSGTPRSKISAGASGITFGVSRPSRPESELQAATHAPVAEASATITPAPASRPLASSAHTQAVSNNFNLLRLVFALLVVAYHVINLSGVAAWSAFVTPMAYAAELGVQGFFVLSGYLVMGSVERSASVAEYAEKRIRRLYPAYAAVVLLCALAALAASPEARADLAGVGRYLGWNLVFLNFLEPNLPGLFEANTFTEVNGALWTLKIEVLFYLVLPVLAWLLHVAGGMRWGLIVAIYVAAEVWRAGFQIAGETGGRPLLIELSRQLPGQMSFFITGVALYLWRDQINWRSPLALVGAVLLVLSFMFPAAEPLRAVGLGVAAVWIAVAIPRLFDAAAFGDLSYGAYIVHFPIIQTIVAAGLFAGSAAFGAGLAASATLAAALAMWWLVERPALRADSAYRHQDQRRPATTD